MRRESHASTSARPRPLTGELDMLLRRCSAGDRRAREQIIVRFLPYAHNLARRYQGRGEPTEDLFQTATVGLIKAVDRYDPERSESFIAFAQPTIQGEIRRHFRDTSWRLHVPRSLQDRALRVAEARDQLRTESGREPSTARIASRLGLEVGEVAEAQEVLTSQWADSFDAPRASDDGERLTLRETVGEPDPRFERIEARLNWGHALRGLPAREREVLVMRIGAGLTQTEIAGRVGVSQMHVSRILRAATKTVAAALSVERAETVPAAAAA